MRSGRIIAELASLLLGVVFPVVGTIAATGAAACELHARGGVVARVVHIQFDNLHLRRDNPNVPSDLEQMPHLLDFLASDGIIGGNHQTSPLAEKATDALTILTGLFGDRTGVPIADTYGYFRGDGSVGFAGAFGYWTATASDGKPLMLAETGKMVPAPWVPFTRAGCDVGAVAVPGLTLQQLAPDVPSVFGAASAEAEAAASDPARAKAELLGIAIHCARSSPLCANVHARPDLLPDEPGGYVGFEALYGHRHVQPVISPTRALQYLNGQGLNGQVIADAAGHPGLPNVRPTAAQSLGYAAAMIEAGVPIVYAAIGDAHDQDTAGQRPWGPGERDYVARLAAYDAAFKAFIDRLAAAGISKRNTLFVVVSAQNDSFVGGPPSPPGCDGITAPCSFGQIGEIETSLNRLLATERHNVTTFDVVSGNAPSFYIRGNPLATDPLTRTLQQDVSKLTVLNPVTGKTDTLAALLADRAEVSVLHMMPASPERAPNFIMFGDTNYFNATTPGSTECAQPPACVTNNPNFPWSHAGVQPLASGSWFGLAGPGVAPLGQRDDLLSHHADLRPTMLALVGLADSYVDDGVVLAEALDANALPPELASGRDAFIALARAYNTLNDPLGQFGRDSLVYATQAIKGSDTGYARYLAAIGSIAARRDALAGEMKTRLAAAAFSHRPIDPADAQALIGRANTLMNEVEDLAGESIGPADHPWKAANDGH
jgi:hypothetical protein